MHYIACGGQDITEAVNPDLSRKACRALDLLFRKGTQTFAVHDGPGVGLALADFFEGRRWQVCVWPFGGKEEDSKQSGAQPDYYKRGGFECIDVIRGLGLSFELGNAMKYIWRAGLKDPDAAVEDLEKAKTYLDFEIRRRQGERK